MQAATRGRVSSSELRPFFIQSTVTHDEEAVKLKPGLVSRSLVQNFHCAGVSAPPSVPFNFPSLQSGSGDAKLITLSLVLLSKALITGNCELEGLSHSLITGTGVNGSKSLCFTSFRELW